MAKVHHILAVPAQVATVPVVAPAPAQARVRYATRTWGPNSVITVNVANPKIGKSAARFALYTNGMLVHQYTSAVGNKTLANADLRWDSARGYVTITNA